METLHNQKRLTSEQCRIVAALIYISDSNIKTILVAFLCNFPSNHRKFLRKVGDNNENDDDLQVVMRTVNMKRINLRSLILLSIQYVFLERKENMFKILHYTKKYLVRPIFLSKISLAQFSTLYDIRALSHQNVCKNLRKPTINKA
jgi:hypothetical protein